MTQKDFNLICAVALNGTIGDSITNSIPWHLPSDLKKFKELTGVSDVVMGAKTFVSIGKMLPKRTSIVIGSAERKMPAWSRLHEAPHQLVDTFARAHAVAAEGFFVIGGQHIYSEALKYSPQKLFITIINKEIEGDVKFPIDGDHFRRNRVVSQSGIAYECVERGPLFIENGIQFQFTEFRRS